MQFLSYISIQDVHIKLVVQGPVVASKRTCVFFFEMSTFFCVTDFYLIEANVFSVYVL